MKKIIILSIIATVVIFDSCKKTSSPTPTPSTTSTTSTATLPSEYVIVKEGSNIDTMIGYSNNYVLGLYPATDINNTYTFHGHTSTDLNNKMVLIIRLPSDSINLGNFPIGIYKTGNFVTTGSLTSPHFDGSDYPVVNGTLAFVRSYSTANAPYISLADNLTSTYFNKINSITRLKTVWNSQANKYSEIFVIEGEYSVHCKDVGATIFKDYTGTYKFQIDSWQL